MELNKKGFIFTLSAIVLLSLFFLIYGINSLKNQDESTSDRVKSLNSFMFSLEENLQRKVYVSGFRVLFLMQKRIIDTGEFITDFNSTFEEVFYNGTIYNEPQDPDLIKNIVYDEIISEINSEAGKINAQINISNPSISVFQEDPWNVIVLFEADFLLKDKASLVLWNKTQSIKAKIPILGFEDPLYLVNSPITNQYNKTPYTTFVTGSDVSNLKLHLENHYYTNSTLAPSFLDRFENNPGPDTNGIESFVYLPDLSAQGITPKDKTVVDYIYFSSLTPSDNSVSGMPSWFKLDDAHLNIYNVSHLTV
jgi:hypothetical protein